jgi:hypothetical protein
MSSPNFFSSCTASKWRCSNLDCLVMSVQITLNPDEWRPPGWCVKCPWCGQAMEFLGEFVASRSPRYDGP